MSARSSLLWQLIAPALIGAVLSLSCSSESPDTGGRAGAGGAAGGRGGGPGGSGSGGTGTGGSGTGNGGSSGGSTGGMSGGGGGSSAGSGGSGSGGSGAGGSGAGGAGGSAMEAGATDGNGARPARVLIYTKRSTPTHDASIPVAVKSLSDLFKTISFEVEASEAMTMFTASNLARFGAVVLVNSNGTPFGAPGTAEAGALLEFVRAGGGVRNVTCAADGQHPVVAKVAGPLALRMDETYSFGSLNPMNQVVLRCDPASGTAKMLGSWVREEGAGRVFYTTLGHGPPTWEAGGPFLTTHAWPAILWTLGR